MQLPCSRRVHCQNWHFLRPNVGLRTLLKLHNLEKNIKFRTFLLHKKLLSSSLSTLPKPGELHLQATCYLYVLRLRSLLLKLLITSKCWRDVICVSHFSCAVGGSPSGDAGRMHLWEALQEWVQCHHWGVLQNLLGAHWDSYWHPCWGAVHWSAGQHHSLPPCWSLWTL